MQQANAFSPTWGQTIFQSANEIAQNQMIRKRMQELQAQKESEKEWWVNKKKSIEADLMKELDESSAAGGETHKKAPSRTSDDDAVLVEGGGPADKGHANGGGKKKKKGKH
jgi:translocation protein SEC66